MPKTAGAVKALAACTSTPLKRGVNERQSAHTQFNRFNLFNPFNSFNLFTLLATVGLAHAAEQVPLAVPDGHAYTGTKIIARTYNSGFALGHDSYNGMGTGSDGKIYYVLSSENIDQGAKMFCLDPKTDQIKELGDLTEACGEKGSKAIPQGKSHVNFVEANGRLYFATHVGVYSIVEGKEMELPLRYLPLTDGEPRNSAASEPAMTGDMPHPELGGYKFEVGSRYLVFLGKNQYNDVPLATLNDEGSHIPLFPGRNLAELKGRTPQEMIETLLKEDIEIRHRDLENAEWRLKRYLGS